MAKAPSKSVEAAGNGLENVVRLHTEINELNTVLKTKKAEFATETTQLKEDSKTIFDEDLGVLGSDDIPSVFGNHEYITGDHLVTVNYKMKSGGLSFTEIGGRAATEVLGDMMDPKEYKKLFKEETKVTDDAERLIEVHSYRPDLVAFNLQPSKLPDAALTLIREKWPEAFAPVIVDVDTYIKEIPEAEVTTEVSTATGFLEKVSSLSDDTKFGLRDFIRKVLASCITSAVKCGNRADA
jgi:hypothetical protein